MHILSIDSSMRASKFMSGGFEFLRTSWKCFGDFSFGRAICWPRSMESFDLFIGVLQPRIQYSVMYVFSLVKADTILRLDDAQVEIFENGTFLCGDINKLSDEILKLIEYFNS